MLNIYGEDALHMRSQMRLTFHVQHDLQPFLEAAPSELVENILTTHKKNGHFLCL